jgi:Tol biopolymer transport system component
LLACSDRKIRLPTNSSEFEQDPAWSPKGDKIAFSSNADGNFEICVMSTDGTGITRLTDNPANDHYPCWSPDGNFIAFTSDRDGNQEIYIMRADGSSPRRLTNNTADDFWPSWSK